MHSTIRRRLIGTGTAALTIVGALGLGAWTGVAAPAAPLAEFSAAEQAARAAASREDMRVAMARADAVQVTRAAAAKLAAERAVAAEAARVAAEQVAAAAAIAARQAEAERASRAAARVGAPKDIARALLAERGWGEDQFGCLDRLWTRESNWQVSADNPSSSAYGIPQALPGSKMASAGADWETNPATQIEWGLGYIAERYGSPCSAWGASEAQGWY